MGRLKDRSVKITFSKVICNTRPISPLLACCIIVSLLSYNNAVAYCILVKKPWPWFGSSPVVRTELTNSHPLEAKLNSILRVMYNIVVITT